MFADVTEFETAAPTSGDGHADAARAILLHLDGVAFELSLAFGEFEAEVGDQAGGLLVVVAFVPVGVAVLPRLGQGSR